MVGNRAAILPFPGDPFLLHYWLQIYEKYWANEVGKLYVYFNSFIEKEVVDYIHELCARYPKVVLIYNPKQIEHGTAIKLALEAATEELVMLVEDDAFIFKSGWVNRCFEMIECGEKDIVGSKRGSCATIISAQAQTKWGLSYEGEGDQGCNFWPNFFFCRRQLLLDTDRDFCAKEWKVGDTIPGIDYLVTDSPQAGDTFVNTSLQLRSMVKPHRIAYVNQYHASPSDIEHFEKKKYLFDGQAPWTHIGSLSSGVGGLLKDNNNRSLAYRTIQAPKGETILDNAPTGPMERKEYERRVAWWLKFVENRDPDQINDFADQYWTALMRIVDQFHLDIHHIRHLQKAYSTIGL